MSDDLGERVAILEKSDEQAHKDIKELKEKKLSKHEFNGFQQVMDAVKSTFHSSIQKLDKTCEKNVVAINSLQTTFANIEKFLPLLIKVIAGFCGFILVLITVIIVKYIKDNGGW